MVGTNACATAIEEFKKDASLGICFTKFKYVGLKTFLPARVALSNNELRDGFLNFLKERNETSLPMCPSMMISKAVLLRIPGYHPYFKGRVAEDIHWIYQILKVFRGITVDKTLYNYSIRKGSMIQIQASGLNAKYAYSFQLLSKIIHKDIHEGINVLDPENKEELERLELDACEEALMENVRLVNETRRVYENSTSFKLGRFILTPWRIIKSLKN